MFSHRLVDFFKAIAIFVLLGLSPTAAQAEEPPNHNVMLYGNLLLFHGPSWVSSVENSIELSEISRKNEKTHFLLELIPKNEKFESWSKIFAVLAEPDKSLTPEIIAEQTYGVYGGACNDAVFDSVQLPKTGNSGTQLSGYLFVIHCPSYRNDPKRGQITAYRILKSGDVTARVYQEWRGPAYDVQDKASWPASFNEISLMVQRLLATSFVSPESIESENGN
ncbi:MAG: hypothetical protein ACJAZW_001995 [Maritalea sp.]|jgi:hypothetical protein